MSISISIYIDIYVCISIYYVYAYVYMHTHTYIYTHIHTYIYRLTYMYHHALRAVLLELVESSQQAVEGNVLLPVRKAPQHVAHLRGRIVPRPFHDGRAGAIRRGEEIVRAGRRRVPFFELVERQVPVVVHVRVLEAPLGRDFGEAVGIDVVFQEQLLVLALDDAEHAGEVRGHFFDRKPAILVVVVHFENLANLEVPVSPGKDAQPCVQLRRVEDAVAILVENEKQVVQDGPARLVEVILSQNFGESFHEGLVVDILHLLEYRQHMLQGDAVEVFESVESAFADIAIFFHAVLAAAVVLVIIDDVLVLVLHDQFERGATVRGKELWCLCDEGQGEGYFLAGHPVLGRQAGALETHHISVGDAEVRLQQRRDLLFRQAGAQERVSRLGRRWGGERGGGGRHGRRENSRGGGSL
jgi:hypothetical protein